MTADLHIHTTASDGRLSPVEIVKHAKQVGLSCIAITDHDTVEGLLNLYNAGLLSTPGLEIIHGIEFNTDLPHHEVHILGYGINIFNTQLQNELATILDGRLKRIHVMLAKLKRLGFAIEYDHIKTIAGEAKAIGRPHVARALVDNSYFSNTNEVFDKLLEKNGPAYVPHYKLTPKQAVALVKKSGGAAVLAHPGLVGNDDIVVDMIKSGIDGLEVYHPNHDEQQIQKYLDMANRFNLLATGGSDFHANPERFPEQLGMFTIPVELAYKLKEIFRQTLL